MSLHGPRPAHKHSVDVVLVHLDCGEGIVLVDIEHSLLSRGCLSCHVPVAGTKRMEFRDSVAWWDGSKLSGKDGVLDCRACHKGHENVGQGKCVICHADRTGGGPNFVGKDRKTFVFRMNEAGIFNREKATMKREPVIERFDHLSRGHREHDCGECHDPTKTDQSERVLTVPWPRFDDPSCVECHVQERYHR